MLNEEVKIPVYFIPESDEINTFYQYIDSDSAGAADTSAFKNLVDSISTNGFQFVVNSGSSQPLTQSANEFQAVNIQGKLNGGSSGADSVQSAKVPTIVITAHYDAFGMATVSVNDFF